MPLGSHVGKITDFFTLACATWGRGQGHNHWVVGLHGRRQPALRQPQNEGRDRRRPSRGDRLVQLQLVSEAGGARLRKARRPSGSRLEKPGDERANPDSDDSANRRVAGKVNAEMDPGHANTRGQRVRDGNRFRIEGGESGGGGEG